jgi:methyltransferase (TIGR00027 family)
MSASIRHVSDTALWVAMYRAIESERPDALFRDPHARRLAGERGAAILRSLPFGESLGWAMVVRTRLIDEAVERAISNGVRTVLNLGAGLDTRAFRLNLPPSLRWFDVDLPPIIEHRRRCLGGEVARCEHAHVAADLQSADGCADLLARIRETDGPTLALSEGLLVYLLPEQVARLARHLHDEPSMRWWVTDVVTPLLARMVGALWQPALAGAPFRFAPTDCAEVFAALGWRETEFRSIWEESIRLRRTMPLAAWWTSIGKFAMPALHEATRRMSGVIVLERA